MCYTCRNAVSGGSRSRMEESRIYRLFRPLIPKPLRPLALRYQELLCYVVVGGLTTLVNFLTYFPLSRILHYLAAIAVAWVCSVTFAFFMNKAFVFVDSRWKARVLIPQGASFAAARLTSLGAEELFMFLLVNRLGFNADLMKVAAQALVALMNYVFSKFIIFRRK